MASRRLLTSVAVGTARAFASRTNDVGGWWALGLILAEMPPAESDYRLDLLTREASPTFEHAELTALGPAWARYLRWSLGRHGLAAAQVRSAVLTLRFERATDVQSWLPGGRPDHPFRCAVGIEDDRGDRHDGVADGHCSPLNDPDKPHPGLNPRRSAGPYHPGRISQRVTRVGGHSGTPSEPAEV